MTVARAQETNHKKRNCRITEREKSPQDKYPDNLECGLTKKRLLQIGAEDENEGGQNEGAKSVDPLLRRDALLFVRVTPDAAAERKRVRGSARRLQNHTASHLSRVDSLLLFPR